MGSTQPTGHSPGRSGYVTFRMEVDPKMRWDSGGINLGTFVLKVPQTSHYTTLTLDRGFFVFLRGGKLHNLRGA